MTTPSGVGFLGGRATLFTAKTTSRRSAVAQMRQANTGSESISIQYDPL
jgi:hypothetical protein